jgi:hypothetical protein
MAVTSTDHKPLSVISARHSTEKQDVTQTESINVSYDSNYLSRYPLLLGKSDKELDELNKAVLRKLDWKFLPCITLMLLMKYDISRLPYKSSR